MAPNSAIYIVQGSKDCHNEVIISTQQGVIKWPLKDNTCSITVDLQYSDVVFQTDGQFYPVSLQSVVPASKYWGTSLKTPHNYPIKVDFKVGIVLANEHALIEKITAGILKKKKI